MDHKEPKKGWPSRGGSCLLLQNYREMRPCQKMPHFLMLSLMLLQERESKIGKDLKCVVMFDLYNNF